MALKEDELRTRPRDGKAHAMIASWLILTDKRRALREIRQAQQLQPRNPGVQAQAASVYEQLYMRKEALAAVAAAIKLGFAVVELQNWPTLENLRQDPRYKRMVLVSIEGMPIRDSND